MSLKTLLHLDSIDGIQNYDTNLNLYHCYNTNLKLNKPITNIKLISLKSIELPIQFKNIRDSNGSNSFIFTFTFLSYSNITVNLKIPETNYTTTTSLINALNTSINAAITSYIGLSLVASITNTYYVTLQTNADLLTLGNSILINNILAFTSLNSLSSGFIYSTNTYNLNIDNYLSIYISNISSGSDTNVNGRLSTFKIPCNATNGQILYMCDSSFFNQSVQITDPSFVLSNFNIIIYDRFGYIINGQNGCYSMTLEVVYDKPIETKEIILN